VEECCCGHRQGVQLLVALESRAIIGDGHAAQLAVVAGQGSSISASPSVVSVFEGLGLKSSTHAIKNFTYKKVTCHWSPKMCGMWRLHQLWVRGHRARRADARAGSLFGGGGALRCLADSKSPSPKKSVIKSPKKDTCRFVVKN
jgi:hypothetical protein